jgi:hypothetical protein
MLERLASVVANEEGFSRRLRAMDICGESII